MSSGATAQVVSIVVAVVLSIAGGIARLFAADFAEQKWPGLHAWFSGYPGVRARAIFLTVVVLAVAGFLAGLALETTATGNRNFLWVAAGLVVVFAAFLAEHGRRTLRQLRLDGRGPRRTQRRA